MVCGLKNMDDRVENDPISADAAGLLWRRWQAGTKIAALPDALRPHTRQAGYAVQARLPVEES